MARMSEERGVYRVLVGKPEGKRPLGRPRRRCVDNIRMNLQEVGCGYVDWIGLAHDRGRWWTLVSAVMNLRVPQNVGNLLTGCKPVSFSRKTLHHGVSIIFRGLRWRHYESESVSERTATNTWGKHITGPGFEPGVVRIRSSNLSSVTFV